MKALKGKRRFIAMTLVAALGTVAPAVDSGVERIELDIAGYLCGF